MNHITKHRVLKTRFEEACIQFIRKAAVCVRSEDENIYWKAGNDRFKKLVPDRRAEKTDYDAVINQ